MPAVQLKQMEADVCENLPAAHGMHAVAPAVFMYEPAAHELQTLRGIYGRSNEGLNLYN